MPLFPNATEEFKKANEDLPAEMRVKLFGTPDVPIPEPAKAEKFDGKEKDFQGEAEKWLGTMGYSRSTEKGLTENTTGKFFIHVPRSMGNPFMLDFFLIHSNVGAYLEVELKTARNKLSPIQKLILQKRKGRVAWNMQEFQKIVTDWEAGVRQ